MLHVQYKCTCTAHIRRCNPATLVSQGAVQQQGEDRQMAAGKQHTALVTPDTAATVHHTELAVHTAEVVRMPAELGVGTPAD